MSKSTVRESRSTLDEGLGLAEEMAAPSASHGDDVEIDNQIKVPWLGWGCRETCQQTMPKTSASCWHRMQN